MVAAVTRRRAAVRPPPRLEPDGLRSTRADPPRRPDGRPGRQRRGPPPRPRPARGTRPDPAGRRRHRTGGCAVARREAPGHRRGRRCDHGRGVGGDHGPGRTPGRTRRDDMERQGGHRRDPRAGRADRRRHRVVVGQRAVVHGRRAPLGRQPLHRLVGVLVPGRRDLHDPADEAHPARHRSARDRQELPGRGRARRRREGGPGQTSWRRWDPVAVARSTGTPTTPARSPSARPPGSSRSRSSRARRPRR